MEKPARSSDTRTYRIYYGAEFCQHRLPSLDDLARIFARAQAKGLRFTLVSPPVTDQKMGELEALVRSLSEKEPASELVVNDWGVLSLLREHYPHVIPIFGRLMNKMLRDPRALSGYREPQAPAGLLSVLRQSGMTTPQFLRLLKDFGIARVELDNLYQGIDIDFRSAGLTPSIHIPWGYVTSGRICLFGSLEHPPKRKFTSDAPCHRACEKYYAHLQNPLPNPGSDGGPFVQKGNTIFYRQDEALVEKGLLWAKEHGARIVVQPAPSESVAYATEDVAWARDWIHRHDLPVL